MTFEEMIDQNIPKDRALEILKMTEELEKAEFLYEILPNPLMHGTCIKVAKDTGELGLTQNEDGSFALGHVCDLIASIAIHDFSYGGQQNYFEVGIYDDEGKMQDPDGWQTIDEVLDTIRAAL